LNFTNQPLTEVIVGIRWDRTQPLTFDELQVVRVAFQELLPDVEEVLCGASRVPSFLVNRLPGLSLSNPHSGIGLDLREAQCQIFWRKNGSLDYPRFQALKNIASLLNDLKVANVLSASLTYINISGSSSIRDLIRKNFDLNFLPDEIKATDVNVGWNFKSVDARLEIVPNDQGFVLATSAGAIVEDSLVETLDKVHEYLLEIFPNILSDELSIEWGLEK
jgi:hypothetical protein